MATEERKTQKLKLYYAILVSYFIQLFKLELCEGYLEFVQWMKEL